MPTNPNMVAIQTVTVGAGGAANIEFTSIPQTYTDLVVKCSLREESTSTNTAYLRFNGNTGANYTRRDLQGSGSGVSSNTGTNETKSNAIVICSSGDTANTFGNAEIYVPNYTGNTNKSFSVDSVSENNATQAYTRLTAGIWNQTSAITSITILLDSGDFAQYSTATLYGVTSAGYGAKATGGIITEDTNYFYHTFLSSGTFTPTQSLSCNIIAVGGGGGGGFAYGGGGGGGAIEPASGYTTQSLSATGYTVTVGGGGAGKTSGGGTGTAGSNSVFAGTSTITANGGGGGGSGDVAGGNGGSGGGGGGGGSAKAGGTASGSNTFAGGSGLASAPNYGAGGGGGATAAGSNGTATTGGNGGAGKTLANIDSALTNMANFVGMTTISSGGGGGLGVGGTGGTGGTGAGNGNPTTPGTNATSFGSGGGGGGYTSGGVGQSGGNGYAGFVVIRYAK